MQNAELVQKALKALRSEPRLGPRFKPGLIRLESDGAVLIEGGSTRSRKSASPWSGSQPSRESTELSIACTCGPPLR
jgi:hypothetical protein